MWKLAWDVSRCLFYYVSQTFFFIICTCFQSTKAVYNRILDLRIATPQIIINFGTFLEEHRYFEEAFKVSKTRRAGHISLTFRAKR